MEEKIYYSLCITVETRSPNNGKSYWKLLRIADLPMNEENKGSKQKNFIPYDASKSDVPHYSEVSMSPDRAQQNELQIWRWWITEKGPWSEPYDGGFYELVFPKNNLKVSDILDNLLNGFPVSGSQRFPFLYTILWSNEEYLCIEITEENLYRTSQGDTVRIPEGTTIGVYQIRASDCIDSQSITQKFESSQKNKIVSPITRRRIYKRIRLPSKPSTELKVQPLEKCLTEYLNQALFDSKYTAEQKQIIQNFFNSDPDSPTSFSAFLQKYYNYDETSPELTELFLSWYNERISVINEFTSTVNKNEEFLVALVEGTPKLRKKYCDYIQKGLIEEKKRILEEIGNLKTEKQMLSQTIQSYEKEVKALNEKETSLNEHNTKISSEIFGKLGAFKELISLLGSTETGTNSAPSLISRGQPGASVITLKPPLLSQQDDEIEILKDHEKSVCHLQENLEEIGINIDGFGSLIVGAHFSRLPALIIGSRARKAAEVISYSLLAEIPATICLPTGFSDYKSLNRAVQESTTDYVILDNAVGSIEEYCYLHLPEEFPEKRFIYILEFAETLSLMPVGIYAHFLIINAEKYLQYPPDNPKILPGKIDYQITTTGPDAQKLQQKLQRELSKLLKGSLLPQQYLVTRIGILQNIIATTEGVDALMEVLLSELVDIGNIKPYPEDYIDMLQTNPEVKFGQTLAKYLTENDA